MRFESARPSIIKAVRQRDLLNTWLRLYAELGTTARIEDFQPDRLGDEVREMGYYSVMRDAGQMRFMIDKDGARLADSFGHSGVGRYIDDYIAPKLTPVILPVYRQCVACALPVYTTSVVHDIHGREVAYERLLLPFFKAGLVSHIIGSLKTICDDGGFEIKNLMRGHDVVPAYKLRVVIDSDMTMRSDLPIPSGDVVEI